MNENLPPLILASTSPRRRELIGRLGLTFHFASVDVDETPRPDESPQDLVQRLSHAKCASGATRYPGALIIAADTVVALDDAVLGKPRDAADAISMLERLRNRSHVVFTGLAISRGEQELLQVATTTVWMRNYTEAEIAGYVATGDPLDKAAAYAIQHPAFHPVERIESCYSNVMGLPICRVYLALRQLGINVPEPRLVLSNHLEADCDIAQGILASQS
jgi:septum formation protein